MCTQPYMYYNQKITDVQKETIPAKGHVKGEVKIENDTESTCEKGGSYDEVVYCTVCNKELSRTTVKTEALGHKWNEGKITTQPTCPFAGIVSFCTSVIFWLLYVPVAVCVMFPSSSHVASVLVVSTSQSTLITKK